MYSTNSCTFVLLTWTCTIAIVLMLLPFCAAFLAELEKSFLHLTGVNIIKSFWKLIHGVDVSPDPQNSTLLSYSPQLTTPSIDDAIYYVHYAAAAYCHGSVLSDWTCKECQKLGSFVHLYKVLNNASYDTQGYIALDHYEKEIVIVFRGSNNPTNIWEDLTSELIKPEVSGGGDDDSEIQIHKGFYESTMSLYPDVLAALFKLHQKYFKYRVVMAGHSLGGAMCIITYYLLSHDLPTKQYNIFTYGEPRPGNQAFADYINSSPISLARIVNEGDLVPHALPASLGFVHHLREFWTTQGGETMICSNHVYEDLNCSASKPSNEFNLMDHSTYFNISIGLNCIDENPIESIWEMLTGK